MRSISRLLASFSITLSALATISPAFGQNNDALALYPGEGLYIAGGTATYSTSDVSSNNFGGGFQPNTSASNFVAGHSGLAFHFAGTGSYLSLSGFTGINLSFGFWMRDNSTVANPQPDNSTVIENSAILNKAPYFTIIYHNGYIFRTSNGGADLPFTVSPGSWHYIFVNRLNRVQKLYVDGVLQGVSTGTIDDNYDYDSGIRCGTDNHTTAYWQGDLDDIRFYNRQLSQQEITFFATAGQDVLLRSAGNIYLAGQPSGTTASSGSDSAPNQSPDSAITVKGGQTLLFGATGSFIDGSGAIGLPISGDDQNNAVHPAENGLSSITTFNGSLVGVFLDDTTPAGSAPTGLDYSGNPGSVNSDDFRTPALRQVFYIGAGGAGGHLNPIIAPAGATRLFLAILDANSNSNNYGNVSVHLIADSAFDAVRDFYETTNVDTQVWSYGFTEPNGTQFHLYTEHAPESYLSGWKLTASDMAVVLNPSGHDITYNPYVLQQPDVLALFPGNDGRKTVVRWTAPTAGDYRVQGRFQDIDITTTDVSIVQNVKGGDASSANTIFTDSINDNTSQQTAVVKNFTLDLTVAAGDTIDFRVGWGDNANYAYDGTGLAVTISPAAAPLDPNSLTIDGDIADGGPIHFVTGTTAAGVTVFLQYSTTPDVEGSWKFVKDGNGVAVNLNDGVYTSAMGVNSYPAGSGISFRAVSSATGNSNVLGPYTLKQAVLSINYTLTSTSDATGAVARIGDDLTYTFNWKNNGNLSATNLHVETPVPTHIDATTNLTKQFPQSALTFNSFGTYVAATNGNNAKIVWNVSDLAPTFGQSVDLKVHLGTDVRLTQQIGLPNNYRVYSSANAPATQATGFSSGSANLSTNIRGPIKLTAALDSGVTSVAPGGTFNYTLTLSNLTSTKQKNAAFVFEVPANTRFVSGAFLNAKGKVLKPLPTGALAPFLANTETAQSEVLVLVGPMAAKATQTVSLTFQAQWVIPSDPHIVTTDYAAGFIDPASSTALTNFKKGTGFANFIDFITNQGSTNTLFNSKNDSGTLSLGFAGSVANQPVLGLIKSLSNEFTDTGADNAGNRVNFVHPGKDVTFILALSNSGNSAAEDVYVADNLPAHITFKSFQFLGKTTKAEKKDLDVIPDPDGHHFKFTGIHLDAHSFAAIQYTVTVDGGVSAPAKGTVLAPDDGVGIDLASGLPMPCTIGSTSTPQTQGGLYGSGPVVVTGDALLARGKVLPLTPRPTVGGKENYYIHYANDGDIPAKGVTLDFPIPAHTTYSKASFMNLGANGFLPGKTMAKPAGTAINAPTVSSNKVSFTFNNIAAGDSGDVMVEVTIGSDAVQQTGSIIGAPDAMATIHDSTVSAAQLQNFQRLITKKKTPPADPAHLNASAVPVLPLDYQFPLNGLHAVPKVGVYKWVQRNTVKSGDNFQIQIIVFNNGAVDASPIVDFAIPANTQFVSASAGDSYLLLPAGNGPGNLVEAKLASNNGPIYPSGNPNSDLAPLHAHTAAALTITLKATGAVGTVIPDSATKVTVDYMGALYAGAVLTSPQGALLTAFIGANNSPNCAASIAEGIVNQQIINQQTAQIIDLNAVGDAGVHQILAIGSSSLVAAGGGNLIAAGGGNLVAAGGGNLVTINGSSALSALANQSSLVAAGGGNILVTAGSSLVATGGGNLIAAGGGNLIGQDGGGLVAAGGGNLITQDGGGLVAAGGGNLVAAGGGNLVAAGGGNLVAAGGGNILASPQGSGAALITPGGSLVASGGGNLVAAGGGN